MRHTARDTGFPTTDRALKSPEANDNKSVISQNKPLKSKEVDIGTFKLEEDNEDAISAKQPQAVTKI